MPDVKREVEIISYLANPIVRRAVKNTARRWRFEAPLATYLQEYYIGLSHNYVPTDTELESFLSCKKCQEGDVSLSVIFKRNYEGIPIEGTKTLINSFFYHYRDTTLRTALRVYNENSEIDPETALSDLVKTISDTNRVGNVGYEVVNYADMDLDKYIEEEMNRPDAVIKSKFNLINDNTPLGGYQKGWLVQIAAPPGRLKAQPLDSMVLTESGFRMMGDLRVGDKVFSQDGTLANVIGIYPQGVKPCYEVTTIDGQVTRCSDEHLWYIKSKSSHKWTWKVLELRELMERGVKSSSGEYKYYVPVNKPVLYPERELPINPYVLGILISEGYLGGGGVYFSSAEPDIATRVQTALGDDYAVKKIQTDNYAWNISCPNKKDKGYGHVNPLRQEIVKLKLNIGCLEKFIPKIYLQSSVEQRKQLLAGLFDGDGCVGKGKTSLEYCTYSIKLANNFVELCRGLGYKVRLHTKQIAGREGEYYRINILTNEKIFSSKKHNSRYRTKPKAWEPKYADTAIKSIRRVDDCEQQCILIDHPSHLYITDDYIVTHNTQFMLNEAVYMAECGHNIAWIALGDMNKKSMLRRIMCLVHHVNKMDLGYNLKRYHTEHLDNITKRICFVYKPAFEVPPSAIINIVNSIESPDFPVDAVFVDYDRNFKSSGEMMYERNNYAYGEMHNIATDGIGTHEEKFKLVMIGCQAAKEYWSREELPEECCADSSGKQAMVDLQICGNCNPRNRYIGTLTIPKSRDGDVDMAKYHLEKWGGIRGISLEEYNVLLNTRADDEDTRLHMNIPNIVSEVSEA